MNEYKHTPGPWIWGDDYQGLFGAGADNYVLSYAPYEGMWIPTWEDASEANARLIAAAPDLLEAADRQCANVAFLLERCKLDGLPSGWREKFERELTEDRTVIAKAQGAA